MVRCTYCKAIGGHGAIVKPRGPAFVLCCAKGECQSKAMREARA